MVGEKEENYRYVSVNGNGMETNNVLHLPELQVTTRLDAPKEGVVVLALMFGSEVAEVGAGIRFPLLQIVGSGVEAQCGWRQQVHHGAGGWGGSTNNHRWRQGQWGTRAKGGIYVGSSSGGRLHPSSRPRLAPAPLRAPSIWCAPSFLALLRMQAV